MFNLLGIFYLSWCKTTKKTGKMNIYLSFIINSYSKYSMNIYLYPIFETLSLLSPGLLELLKTIIYTNFSFGINVNLSHKTTLLEDVDRGRQIKPFFLGSFLPSMQGCIFSSNWAVRETWLNMPLSPWIGLKVSTATRFPSHYRVTD